MRISVLCMFVLFVNQPEALAQIADANGCNDSPFFKRIQNSYIINCSKDTDEVDLTIEPDSSFFKSGIKTIISYGYDASKAKLAPSFSKIVKWYEIEVAKKGGMKMYYSADEGKATLFFKTATNEIWTVIDDGSGDGEGYHSITLLESKIE